MKIRFLFFFLSIGVLFLFSCNPPKTLSYLQDFSDTTKEQVKVKFPEPVILKGDQLFIHVYSDATDQGKTDQMYNMAAATTGALNTQGYLVDFDGYIQYPRVGKVKAEGLTKAQLGDEIKRKLEPELKNPTVIVRLMNFRVTLLGEVMRPGPVSLPSEKITILEAIGLAGDISIYGKKDDVVVIREVGGEVQHAKLDLSSKEIFDSPYYFLRQNDVVLINPDKNKARLSDQVFNQRMNIAFSIINTIALLYNIFR